MDLLLDIGNTLIKAGMFSDGKLKDRYVFDDLVSMKENIRLFDKAGRIMIASVTHISDEAMRLFPNRKVRVFDSRGPGPLKMKYETPNTLGADRLLASIGSYSFFPNRNVLTVDAGTCIKYNFVNENNEFMGGGIAPGIGMRLRSMHEFTAKLPLLTLPERKVALLGMNTADSMYSGAFMGALAEIEGVCSRYQEDYGDLCIVITGGDAPRLCEQLKIRFFAEPDLVLIGLNKALEYSS